MAELDKKARDPITGRWSDVEDDVIDRALNICEGGFFRSGISEGTVGRTSSPPENRLRQGYPNSWKYQLIYQTNSKASVRAAERAIAEECEEYLDNRAPAGGGGWGSPPYYVYLAYSR